MSGKIRKTRLFYAFDGNISEFLLFCRSSSHNWNKLSNILFQFHIDHSIGCVSVLLELFH